MRCPSSTRSRRFARPAAAAAVLVAAGSMLVAPLAAYAAPAMPTAWVRTAHLSPDTPSVDMYVTGTQGSKVIRTQDYGHFSAYIGVPAGAYSVIARLAGSSASSPALVSWKLDLGGGKAYTAAVIGSGSARRGTALADDLRTPKAGKASVRLIQAASSAPTADVMANGNLAVATAAPFASATAYVDVPAGTWPLVATSHSADMAKVRASISLPSGSVSSLVLLDKTGGGLSLISTLDSSASGATPSNGIDTGGGGLAPPAPSSGLPAWWLAGAFYAVLAGAAWMRRSSWQR